MFAMYKKINFSVCSGAHDMIGYHFYMNEKDIVWRLVMPVLQIQVKDPFLVIDFINGEA
jgi:hypothetical protein